MKEFSVIILKRSIDAPGGAVSLYSVCSCMFLTGFLSLFLFDGYIKLWRNCCERTLTSAFIHMFERRHQKTLSTNFCCLRQNIKRTSEQLLLMLFDEIRNIYSIGLLIFRRERNKRNSKFFVVVVCNLVALWVNIPGVYQAISPRAKFLIVSFFSIYKT